MPDQTPPAVTEEQFQKMIDVVRGLVRKDGITGREFQHVLGHPGFAKGLGFITDLVTGYRQSLPPLERPVWKTIRIGNHPDNGALRQTVLDNGYRISNWADDILGKVGVTTEPEEIDLVIVTVAELGFPNGGTREKIYSRAESLGLMLCPAEVGPQLRLQYPADEQPLNEWLLVAMEPIKVSDGYLEVFYVARHAYGAWLGSSYDSPGHVWHASGRWVFCRK